MKKTITEKKSLTGAALKGFIKTGIPSGLAGGIFGFAPQHLNVHAGLVAALSGMNPDAIKHIPVVPSWPDMETQLVAGPAIGAASLIAGGAYGAAKEVYLAKSQNRQEELPRGTKVYVKKRGKLITGVVDRHNHQKGWTRIVADHDKKEYKFASRHLMTV